MAVFIIGVGIFFVTIFIALILGVVVRYADKAVAVNAAEVEENEKAYNPAMTMGYEVKVQVDPDEQVHEARKLAAKKAAALPRGANMRIGRLGSSTLQTAGAAVKEDPFTAAKIAEFHGWDGAAQGIPAGGVPAAGAVAAPVAAPAAAGGGKIKLVPGKDYPFIEITDDMDPAEKRKARIANSKAKSAAMKAAKAAGVAPTAAPAAAPVAAAAAPAAPSPVAVGIEPPQLVEITDDMAPDEKRKARIANSKAKSAFNKALKAAGIDPKTVEIGPDGKIVMPEGAGAPAAAPAPAAAAPAPAAAAPAPAADGKVDLAALGISAPELTELTDDMSPEEKRAARIANSKAKSAFNKALKAAGVDPKSVKL